jgi:hypothetical protein
MTLTMSEAATDRYLITYSHANTSSQTNVGPLTGANVISEVQVDTYGHVTTLSTRALTLTDLSYSIPTLDQVTTAGNSTTNNITVNNITARDGQFRRGSGAIVEVIGTSDPGGAGIVGTDNNYPLYLRTNNVTGLRVNTDQTVDLQ